MPPSSRPEITEAEIRPGFYMTDERRLFRVMDAALGHVQLENVATPQESPAWVPIAQVRAQNMRLVRPA